MCGRFAQPVSPEKPDKSSLYDGMSGKLYFTKRFAEYGKDENC